MQPQTINLLICELSGRWAAALRMALERSATTGRRPPSRIQEVRRLAELVTAIDENPTALPLVEVQPDNLTSILALLAQFSDQSIPIVALVDDSQSVDVLYEAGAAFVVETPRQITAALKLAIHLATSPNSPTVDESASIADWAHAALPWQPT